MGFQGVTNLGHLRFGNDQISQTMHLVQMFVTRYPQVECLYSAEFRQMLFMMQGGMGRSRTPKIPNQFQFSHATVGFQETYSSALLKRVPRQFKYPKFVDDVKIHTYRQRLAPFTFLNLNYECSNSKTARQKCVNDSRPICATCDNSYFCGMFSLAEKMNVLHYLVALLTFTLVSCDAIWKENNGEEPLARVGEKYLYKEDIAPLLGAGISKEDSISFVTTYINNWASKQLLLSKAKINLSEAQLAEFDELVSDYRNDLYTRAYKEALVQQLNDTVVSKGDMRTFYDKEKNNFRLKEPLVKIRFVELPKQFLDKETVTQKLKSFKTNDVAYLDSIGVQFKKLNFNDSIWVPVSRVIDEIPPLTLDNQAKYLKKSQFFELEDTLGVYLAKVTGVLQINDIAPLSYIEPTIKQVLINRRKLDFLRKLETEVIDEAIKDKEFEVYEQDN